MRRLSGLTAGPRLRCLRWSRSIAASAVPASIATRSRVTPGEDGLWGLVSPTVATAWPGSLAWKPSPIAPTQDGIATHCDPFKHAISSTTSCLFRAGRDVVILYEAASVRITVTAAPVPDSAANPVVWITPRVMVGCGFKDSGAFTTCTARAATHKIQGMRCRWSPACSSCPCLPDVRLREQKDHGVPPHVGHVPANAGQSARSRRSKCRGNHRQPRRGQRSSCTK